MGQNLIKMYYEFAVNDSPIFAGLKIQPSTPENVQVLVISSNTKFSMSVRDESYGNVKFWEKMENALIHNNEKLSDEL